MNIKIDIEGLEELMDNVQRANELIAELTDVIRKINTNQAHVTAKCAATHTPEKCCIKLNVEDID